MTKIRLHCNRNSKGVMALVRGLREKGLNCLRIKRRGSSYTYPSSHTIINWGGTQVPSRECAVLNSNAGVSCASSKLTALRAMEENDVPHVPFTTSKDEAEEWILEEDAIVFCRTLDRGSQGKGIVVAHSVDELVPSPIYTQYIESSREMRVHVFNGSVIDYALKKRLSSESREERGIGECDKYVKNTAGGYIFARINVECSDEVKDAAVRAVEACGLTFGAVDILVDPVAVIEVNTAPGLQGTTLDRYVSAFYEYFRGV